MCFNIHHHCHMSISRTQVSVHAKPSDKRIRSGQSIIPLKLGLMRASYPDVLPMSLSRKSEGDSCGPALLGGFISSLQELSLILPRERQKKGRYRQRERKEENSETVCTV